MCIKETTEVANMPNLTPEHIVRVYVVKEADLREQLGMSEDHKINNISKVNGDFRIETQEDM